MVRLRDFNLEWQQFSLLRIRKSGCYASDAACRLILLRIMRRSAHKKKENANALYASIHALAFSFFMAKLFVGNFSQWLTDRDEGAIIY